MLILMWRRKAVKEKLTMCEDIKQLLTVTELQHVPMSLFSDQLVLLVHLLQAVWRRKSNQNWSHLLHRFWQMLREQSENGKANKTVQ